MSMREKYQSLALVDLKEIAKARGMKGTSSMKKADIIDAMVALDESERSQKNGESASEQISDAENKKEKASDNGTEGREEKASDSLASDNGTKAADGQAPKKTDAGRGSRPAGRRVSDEKRTGTSARQQPAEKSGTGENMPQTGGQSTGRQEAGRQSAEQGAGRQSVEQGMGRPAAEQGTSRQSAEQGTARQAVPQQESRRPIPKRQDASGRMENHSASVERGNGARNQSAGNTPYRNGEKRVVRRYPQGQPENGQRRYPETRNAAEAGGGVEIREASESKSVGQAVEYAEGRNQTEVTRQDNPAGAPVYGGNPSGNEEERFPSELDSGISANGILEVLPDGYGFIRSANYLPGDNDVYVAPSQIRRFGLKTGDIVVGNTRVKTQNEKFSALLYVKSINGQSPDEATKRYNFEDMTPIFPDERIRLELSRSSVSMRIMDLMSPVGKGQRGMIVSPPKAGKTTLLKQVAQSVKTNHPDMHLIILLIDERPEEVTDFREAIEGPNVEVIYSTFDELPEHHKRVAEMVIELAKRLVEHKKYVMILLDSITRLTRAYNLVIPPSGRTLSGGLDPAALHMPKRFFGAARNMREGGSLTILATALVDTGSRMDDVIYEEFKGTGNMEIVLDRKLSERRIFPAIDIPKSSTRREDLLLSQEELEATGVLRKALNGLKPEEAVDKILDMFTRTRNNVDFVNVVKKMHFV